MAISIGQSIAGESVDEGYLRAAVAKHSMRNDPRFSDAGLRLASHFAPYLHKDVRLKVRTIYTDGEVSEEFVRTGTVGMTGGWAPVFLLMHRSNAHGSWDTLGERDEIIAIWNGRRYEEVKPASAFVKA
jgi:hypothetical protein